MSDKRYERVVLVGFSGTGKSTTARLLAERLGWQCIDTDADIEREAGKSIPAIFASEGEPAFRAMERRHLLAALEQDRAVVATGGGAVVDPALWTDEYLHAPDTLTVTLDATPPVLLDRLLLQAATESGTVERPMLAGNDPLARIAALKEQRWSSYSRADLILDVERLTTADVTGEIASLVHPLVVTLDLPTVRSSIHVAAGLLRWGPSLIGEQFPRAQRFWIITDENVDRHLGAAFEASLATLGRPVARRSVPPGEGSKSWELAGELIEWLLRSGTERGDVVVALGGGVVGDLAGFVAATALRGVGLIQVPTTLLAMVDSSVGGKTGLNATAGKNLIGAFYQPPLVLIDPTLLDTLPERELRSGWAEVIKHAIIQPSTPDGQWSDLLSLLELNNDALRARQTAALSYLIRRNVALKASVVREDEREASLRAILNYGHTLGHGIEAAGYRYLHGEAIAVGMRAVGSLAVRLNLVDHETISQHTRLLDAFGLPARAAVDPDRVMAHMAKDKKKAAGQQRWVLAKRGGGVTVTTDVPLDLARQALLQHLDADPLRPD